MYPRELLNDWDKKIMAFLNYLGHSEQPVSKKELCQRLNLTRPTLIKLVGEVTDVVAQYDGFRLVTTNNDYYLEVPLDERVRTVFEGLLPESRKFQILMTLFQQGSIKGSVFADFHNMSMTTYYHEIRELNVLLKEFQLEIKNGQLVGGESQIRSFFSAVFFFAYDYRELDSISNNYVLANFIVALQEEFQIQVDRRFLHDLGLYLHVAKRRHDLGLVKPITLDDLMANDYAKQDGAAFMEALRDSDVMVVIRQLVAVHLGPLDFLHSQEEQLLLLLFFMSHHFPSSHSLMYQKLKDLEQETAFCSCAIIKTFLEAADLSLEAHDPLSYSITKALWTHLLKRGTIEIEMAAVNQGYLQGLELSGGGQQFQGAIRQLRTTYPEMFYGGKEDQQLLDDLGRAFLYLYQKKLKIYKIGVCYIGNQLLVRQMTDFYIHELTRYPNISAVAWQPDEQFDLIITNYQAPSLYENARQVHYLEGTDPLRAVKQIVEIIKQATKV